MDEQETVPIVIDKLFMAIELKALFVEGIYRKSAAVGQVRNVRREIENAGNIFFDCIFMLIKLFWGIRKAKGKSLC